MTDRKTISVDGVYDIETEHWDTFVVGGLWTRERGFRYFDWHHEEEYVDALLKCEGSIWAHNGGRYDALWFLQWVRRLGISAKVVCSGQRIITVQIGKLKIRDSAALVPMSLEKASQIGTVRKTRTELPCTCHRLAKSFEGTPINGCGGYCAIRKDMPESSFRKVVSYLEQDCLATASFLDTLVEYAEEYNLDLCSTVGASSYSTARRIADIHDAYWNEDKRNGDAVYHQTRAGYFGGRTQVFRPFAEMGYRYDINSAYPAALASLSLPIGRHHSQLRKDATRAYLQGKPGIFSAVVRVPESFCPPLPIRCRDRIAYPTGQVKGSWARNELEYAESLGCRIESIQEGVTWNDSAMVLAPFCRYVWGLRDKAGPKTSLGTWLKWFANSLTGKLAQKTETERVYINPPADSTWCPANYDCKGVHPAPECCIHKCTKRCGGWQEIANGIFTRCVFHIPDNAHIHWAAYLTAWTRITLHKQLVADGKEGLSSVYCDTDSVIATEPRTENIGDQLGQFKEEGDFVEFEAVAPKTYRYIDPNTGEFIARSKGIPDAGRNWLALRTGVTINRGVNSFKSAARGNGPLFARKSLTRVVRGGGEWFGDRRLGKDGLTWPTDIKDLRSA